MKDIRHQSLETHILHTGDILSTLEILGCTIGSAFPCVVDKVLESGRWLAMAAWRCGWVGGMLCGNRLVERNTTAAASKQTA